MNPDTMVTLYLCVWLLLCGAAFGSFIECAVWRWAHGEPMFRGRSHCAACGHVLGLPDLVPLLTYLVLRGRCRHCGEKIPAQCFRAEVAGAVVFVCFGIRFGPSAALAQWLIFGALLLAVSLADIAQLVIPDCLLLAMIVNRAAWVLILRDPLLPAAKTALVSLCAGALPLLIMTLLMEWALRRSLMGGGDIKLLAAFSFYLEWPHIVLTLFGGCLLGILGAAAFKKRGAFAFGPYLAAACALAVCFGDPLTEWYLRFLR